MNNADLHAQVTQSICDRIKASITSGTPCTPWSKPWASIEGLPKGASGKEYRGINLFLLSMMGYSNPFWFTFNKVRALKGSVRKGEKSTLVVLWNFIKKVDKDTGEEKKVALLKYYRVFNFEQCDNLPSKYAATVTPRTIQDIPKAEAIVKGWDSKPQIKHGGGRAYYSPAADYVGMPTRESFKGDEEYFSTLFHELIHSTGHTSRLAREFGGSFGNEKYAFEELVAEMGAAMLCATAGIDNTVDNSIAYLSNWLSKLQSNPDWLIKAAGKAQKAVDLILGVSYAPQEGSEGEGSEEG